MLHSLKANLVNLQDENKPTLHADCYISTSPVEGVSYIPDAWSVACFSPRVLPEPAFIRQVDGPRFFYNSRYMGYNEFILIVNAASVIILLVMALLLCLAARFKGESSYAAMIIVVSTVPVYIYNVLNVNIVPRKIGCFSIYLGQFLSNFQENFCLFSLQNQVCSRLFPVNQAKLHGN